MAQLGKLPTKVACDKFSGSLAPYLNELSDSDVSQMRKGLASQAGRTDLRNQLVRYLQETYNKEYGLGLLLEERSLAKDISSLELELNRVVNAFMTEKYGTDWTRDQNALPDQSDRRRIKQLANRGGAEPWEYLNFLTTVNSIVGRREHWDGFFAEIFRDCGIKSSDELKLFATRLWDYRSDKLGHERSQPAIYSRKEESLVRSMHDMVQEAIEQATEEIGLD